MLIVSKATLDDNTPLILPIKCYTHTNLPFDIILLWCFLNSHYLKSVFDVSRELPSQSSITMCRWSWWIRARPSRRRDTLSFLRSPLLELTFTPPAIHQGPSCQELLEVKRGLFKINPFLCWAGEGQYFQAVYFLIQRHCWSRPSWK